MASLICDQAPLFAMTQPDHMHVAASSKGTTIKQESPSSSPPPNRPESSQPNGSYVVLHEWTEYMANTRKTHLEVLPVAKTEALAVSLIVKYIRELADAYPPPVLPSFRRYRLQS
jgi:hypothetical protein